MSGIAKYFYTLSTVGLSMLGGGTLAIIFGAWLGKEAFPFTESWIILSLCVFFASVMYGAAHWGKKS